MRNNKITVIFEKEDASKFEEISKKSKWEDKFIISIALRSYYKKFSSDWKKAVIKALEDDD